MKKHNCFDCRFLLSFTPKEAQSFRTRLAERGLNGDFFGGCTHQSPNIPFIIRRYLDHPIGGCQYWEPGYFQDRVGMICPRCKEGQVVVVRPAKDKQTYTMIGCSRYPNCSFKTQYLPLETRCRFCDVPLMLSAGDELACFCPECERRAPVPLTVASWPQLFKSGDTCPHNQDWAACEICTRSREEKRSVIDLELPVVAHYWLRKESEQQEVRRSLKVKPGQEPELPELEYSPWDDEYQELMRELDEYAVGWARADEEGWFYPD